MSYQTFVEAEAEPSRPPRARVTPARARRLSRAPPPRANSRRRAVPAASRAGKVEDARHAGPPHKVHCLEPGVVFVSYEGNPDITPIAEHDA